MNDEQRQEIIRRLQQGEELSPEWARILFPPEKREYELVYHGKEREEDIIANTLAVPLQKVRTFGKNGDGWHNKLIFGDNLQVMKSLLELKRSWRAVQRRWNAWRQTGLYRSTVCNEARLQPGNRIRELIRTKFKVLRLWSSCAAALC